MSSCNLTICLYQDSLFLMQKNISMYNFVYPHIVQIHCDQLEVNYSDDQLFFLTSGERLRGFSCHQRLNNLFPIYHKISRTFMNLMNSVFMKYLDCFTQVSLDVILIYSRNEGAPRELEDSDSMLQRAKIIRKIVQMIRLSERNIIFGSCNQW